MGWLGIHGNPATLAGTRGTSPTHTCLLIGIDRVFLADGFHTITNIIPEIVGEVKFAIVYDSSRAVPQGEGNRTSYELLTWIGIFKARSVSS